MRRWVVVLVASFLILAVFKIVLKSSIGFGLPWNYIPSSCPLDCFTDVDCKTEAEDRGCELYECDIPSGCWTGECKFYMCSGGGGGEEDPCKDAECDCGDKECDPGLICENQKCRLPRAGESCKEEVGCDGDIPCLPGCVGEWICCDEGQGAYCEDPPGGTPTSKCGKASCSSDGQDGGQEDKKCDFCKQHPEDPGCGKRKKKKCVGCVDINGDCYPEDSCVTSIICSSGWAKCNRWNNGIYSWGCAAEAECGGSGGGGGGGTGDVNEPIFDLLEVRVDILHDGINPEEPILKVECDEEDNESSGFAAALLAVLSPVRTAGARGSFRGRIGFRRGPCTCPRPP